MPEVAADTRFRERLRAEFVEGELRGQGRTQARLVPEGRRFRSGILRWRVLLPAAAAAVLVVIITLSRGPALELALVNAPGAVTVNGRSYDATDRPMLESALQPGAVLVLAKGTELDLLDGDAVVYELSSATATLPQPVAGWRGAKTAEWRLERGEIRVLTGPDFRGRRLLIETPEGVAEVSGTLLSVARDETATCVCVHAGVARVGVHPGDLESVPAGKRRVMFADGRPPIITDIEPSHREGLIKFDAKFQSQFP
jgi:FecR protein